MSSDRGFEVDIPESLAKVIERLPFELAEDVTRNLDLLGLDPDLGRRHRSGTFRPYFYTFRVSRPPLVMRLSVAYRFHPDERRITILAIGFTRGDPPEPYDPFASR